MSFFDEVPFSTLLGKTLVSAEKVDDDRIRFITKAWDVFDLYHDQDCCESVTVDDICGNLDWLVGSLILFAEEVCDGDEEPKDSEYDESYTWTFYHLRTMKGTVTIRWYGTSNGYYSESVSLHKKEAGSDY